MHSWERDTSILLKSASWQGHYTILSHHRSTLSLVTKNRDTVISFVYDILQDYISDVANLLIICLYLSTPAVFSACYHLENTKKDKTKWIKLRLRCEQAQRGYLQVNVDAMMRIPSLTWTTGPLSQLRSPLIIPQVFLQWFYPTFNST